MVNEYLSNLRILCVEDDLMSQTLLRSAFFEEQLDFSSSLESARMKIRSEAYDAFLLDLNLPDGSALDLLSDILSMNSLRQIPTLFISGSRDTSEIVRAFELGAEDFIHKPFDPEVLKARVYAKIERARKTVSKVITMGPLKIDLLKNKVWTEHTQNGDVRFQPVVLTSIEYKVLLILAQSPQHFASRDVLSQEIWGDNHRGDRTLDSHVAHLRGKLTSFGLEIEALKGQGYRIDINA